jgi:hypothetical protein
MRLNNWIERLDILYLNYESFTASLWLKAVL